MTEARTCRHCGRKPVSRPRWLCWGCYATPNIRIRYDVGPDPETARFASRSESGEDFFGPSVVGEPTACYPGTVGKESVITDRVKAKQSLFHPKDAKRDLR